MISTLMSTQYTLLNYIEIIVVVLIGLVGCAAGIERVIGWFTGGQKAREAAVDAKLKELAASVGEFVDREALEKRFSGIENKQQLTSAEVVNQHNTLMEYERKRTELTGEFRSGIETMREKIHNLETVPGRVGQLEAKLDNLTSQINDLKTGQRDLRNELREDMKNNKGEIIDAIKAMK